MESLNEDVEKHDKLNPKLFSEDNKLKPEVKEKIDQIVNEFIEGLNQDNIRMVIKDVVLIGSNASYNYNKDSDLDLHIMADTSTLECPDNLYPALYSAYRSIFNNKFDIDFYDIPVEVFVETEGVPTVSNGIYSVGQNDWIKVPVKEDIPDIDQEALDAEVKKWEDRYKAIIESEELEEEIHTDKIDKIDAYIEELYDLRKNGLPKTGEYGIENLTFKEIRSKGYLDNLKELKAKLIGRELSLESLDEEMIRTIKISGNDDIEEDNDELKPPIDLDYFPNKLGINLNSVESETWTRQDDGQLTDINIKFIPADEELNEALSMRDIYRYRAELQRLTYHQPIIQQNGRFDFYNVKDNEVDYLIRQLRNLDYIDYVQKNAGKYDFSHPNFKGLQPRLYNVYGFIKN